MSKNEQNPLPAAVEIARYRRQSGEKNDGCLATELRKKKHLSWSILLGGEHGIVIATILSKLDDLTLFGGLHFRSTYRDSFLVLNPTFITIGTITITIPFFATKYHYTGWLIRILTPRKPGRFHCWLH